MSDEQPRTHSILELFKPLVLVLLIAISGLVTWSYYQFDRTGFQVYFMVAFLTGSLAGILVRVPLISTWAVMGLSGGLFTGLIQGWQYAGWIGVVPGGLIGGFCGLIAAMLLSMGLSFILVLCGIDPFVNGELE